MLLRRETAADVRAIDEVHDAAFERPVEGRLVHALRADAGWVPALSLVAQDRQGRVVGHVVGTLDLPLAVLLGAPGYYGRFGFVPASTLDVGPPDPAWGAHFQARPLGTYGGERGPFAYAAPFADL